MDLPNQELEILRKELKTWEKGFEIEFGRKPTTQDIKQRPSICTLDFGSVFFFLNKTMTFYFFFK
jgi:hypothetical protein